MKQNKKILVLGAGLVGKDIAIDLAKYYKVKSVDLAPKFDEFENTGVEYSCELIDTESVGVLADGYDVVVNALPGSIGYNILESLIKAKKNVVDIAFFPEDVMQLDQLAKDNGVTAIVDFGVAPGLCGALLGMNYMKLEKVNSFKCMVGGLPENPQRPFMYKAPFSPSDVIEEYTRPARLKRNGKVITLDALSEPETVACEYLRKCTLEAFNTDGLRTLLQTMPDIPNMSEKTIRYVGHRELMLALRDGGFFDECRSINGMTPLEFTSAVLFPQWHLNKGEKEFTYMVIDIVGETDKGDTERHGYKLFDTYDGEAGVSSMARTTGYSACAAVHLIAKGMYKHKGISPPEYVGQDEKCMRFILDYLQDRYIAFDYFFSSTPAEEKK